MWLVPGLGLADTPRKPPATNVQVGNASWYGNFHQGRKTASGEHFDPQGLTAAHPTLPLDSQVRVTNLKNGRSVDVRINDRGPFGKSRVIDLSRGAAEQIGLKRKGVAKVKIEPIRATAQTQPATQPATYYEPKRIGY
jgi:rare lipoprotein A